MVKKGGISGFTLQNFGLFRNKKALSDIVASLIIILLVIVAAGIIWVVVRNVVQSGSEQIEFGKFMFDLTIKNAFIDGQEVKVDVRRSPGGGDLIGIKFIFLDDSGSSHIVERDIALEQLEQRRFVFTSEEVGGISIVQIVSIAPVYESSGKEVAGDITDTAAIRESPPPEGGNGEEPPLGPTCTIDDDCLVGWECIDNECVVIYIPDVCDEENLCPSGYECIGSECVCTATCDTFGYQCGTVTICGESVSCGECGFGEFCSANMCVEDNIINSGVVQAVFTINEPFQFSSADLPYVYESPPDSNMQGRYVNFTGLEVCVRIDFHYRIVSDEYIIDYVRLENVTVGLTPELGYSIWNNTQCGYD